MPHWTEAVRRLEQLKLDIPKLTGNEMVNFALDNIRKESFEGKPWPKRKAGAVRDSGRNLLVDTGAGRRSIRVLRSTPAKTELTANDYMQAHNEGEQGTFSVRAHTRTRKGRSEQVSSHSRKMNLPERRFTGKSNEQTSRIQKVITNRIIKALS